MIYVNRVYDKSRKDSGKIFLVDRLWPRGIKKEELENVIWIKQVAPSNDLRHWYHNNPEKWKEFEKSYHDELDSNPENWKPILEAAGRGDVTLLYSSKDEKHNNAVVLKNYLEEKLKTVANKK